MSSLFDKNRIYLILIAFIIFIFSSISLRQSGGTFYSLNFANNYSNIDNFYTLKPSKHSCNVTINLPSFESDDGNSLSGQQVFFLETSGARWLSGRQVCSVESAALHSQIGRIHLLFKSTQIDLNKRKAMCELYHSYKNVHFYTLNFTRLFEQTPVEGIEKRIDQAVDFKTFSCYITRVFL